MNREILFRGKRIDNGEWVIATNFFAIDEDAMIAIFKVLRNTVGQFTGLYDENGSQIFEDDIVVFDEAEDPDTEHSVVVFDDGKFKLKYCNYGYMDDLDGATAEMQIVSENAKRVYQILWRFVEELKMKKDIWIGVVINRNTDDPIGDAKIFGSKDEAVNWVYALKKQYYSTEGGKEKIADVSIYIGEISTAIDYARFPFDEHRGTRDPIGRRGMQAEFTNSEVIDIVELIRKSTAVILEECGVAYTEEWIENNAPTDCRKCDHRYGNKCNLFDRKLTAWNNGSDEWGFIRCDECKQAEVEDANNN